MKTKAGIDSYRLGLRAAVRGLWRGVTDEGQFSQSFGGIIRRRLTQAWNEGAAVCGVLPAERTPEEGQELISLIAQQQSFIPGFSADIVEGSKARGGLLRVQLARVERWINRYPEMVQRGKAAACGNRKLRWTLGDAEHCSTCLRLNGKVRRAQFWQESGILPRVPGANYLECRGYNCACSLLPTNERASPGRLPRLP
ncbi:MAG: hypothetical protein ACYTEQ_22195 [Planctomycetota bacterium]|jgi:hypothetical protein